MLLESLEAHNWRNLGGVINWGSGLNVIYGDNGQGKTNWLEAIYLLATTKSFRTASLQEGVKFDQELAVVRGTVARSLDVHRDLQVSIQGNLKSITVNGKREPISRYLSQLHVVAFTANDLDVVRGAPESRRRFLDRGLVSLHPSYLKTIADYSRVIKQKNRLLQDAVSDNWETNRVQAAIGPWNEQLVRLGTAIHEARLEYVDQLSKALESRLFDRESVTIRYASSFEGKGNLQDYGALISERLQLRLGAELSAGYALIGPHRDDLEILFDGRDMRAFGSAGQQRSALIMLDLAAIGVYHSWHKEYPLFLIDDVDAELDQNRTTSLLDYLEGRTQTFITTSKESLVERYTGRASVYRIISGAVAPRRANHLTSMASAAE